jgi:ligand-binding sensor domain-containing protein
VTGIFVYAGNQWITLRDETLPGTFVTGITADRVGNIWVGTTGGLAMFDGSSWHIYKRGDGLGGNHARQVCEDAQGHIWAFIYGNMNFLGLSCFDGRDWTFFKTGKDIPPGNIISGLEDFRQSGMILTRSGFGRYDGKSWFFPGPGQEIEGTRFFFLDTDTDGSAWITTDKGLFMDEGRNFSKKINPAGGTWEAVAMLCDSRGRTWVATALNEIYLHEGGTTRRFDSSHGLLKENVREIIEDKSGRIWLLYRKEAVFYQF